jgi:hypothetical protein
LLKLSRENQGIKGNINHMLPKKPMGQRLAKIIFGDRNLPEGKVRNITFSTLRDETI